VYADCRESFWFLWDNQQEKPASSASTSDLLTQSYFNPALFDLTHKSP